MSTETKPNLPALIKDLGLAVKADTFNKLLNTSPKASWMKEHNGKRYQPIERVKNSLVTIFQDYDWEIGSIQIMANSILVYGHLSIINPVTGRQRRVGGVGAWPIQLKSGSQPLEIENIIQDAIQKNAPAAESLALKNAAAKLGKIFSDGKSTVEFTEMYSKDVPMDEIRNSQ